MPERTALPQFQRLRDACRRATQQHPQLGVALLFSGSTTWLLAEGDAHALAAVAQLLQATGLDSAPEAALGLPAPCPPPHATGNAEGAEGAEFADSTARELAPGQCRVGYLDGDDCQALGPAHSPPAHKVAAFWRLWRGADRG